MLVNYSCIAAIVIDNNITGYAVLALSNRGRAVSSCAAIQAAALSCKYSAACHINEAIVACQPTNLSVCMLVALVNLLHSDSVIPGCTVFQRQLHAIADAEAVPVSLCAIKLNIHRAVAKALPMCAVLHKQIYCTKLALGYAIATGISIVAFPIGVFALHAQAYAALRAHASVRYDITDNNCSVVTCAYSIAILILQYVEVHNAIVRRYKFTVSTDCSPCTVSSLDATAANINRRSNCAHCFVGVHAVC